MYVDYTIPHNPTLFVEAPLLTPNIPSQKPYLIRIYRNIYRSPVAVATAPISQSPYRNPYM